MKLKLAGRFAVTLFLYFLSMSHSFNESLAATKSNDVVNQFIGSWSLVSFTDVDEHGKTIDRYGQNAFGRISYGVNGKMMVVLMRHG